MSTRRWTAALLGVALAAAAPAAATASAAVPSAAPHVAPSSSRTGPATADVVVQVEPGASAQVRAAVSRLGGSVTADLPLVDGFAATVPHDGLAPLAAQPGVRLVSDDREVAVQGAASGPDGGSGATPLAPRVLGAPAAWAAGATGAGVTVALVDTGVAAVPDLAGRIVPVRGGLLAPTTSCYDLSGEGSCRDSFGHGTFMAGLIAGNGAGGAGGPTGTAPGARILSVKVAGADGAADVSTVLAAIQWVVSHRDVYGVKVLNLSLGTDSVQPWEDDPLNYAVERAWEAGIVVVVAAANTGPAPGTIAKPGDDPWVVTVGAVDDQGTLGLGDDHSPDFSSRGPTVDGVAKPDVVAPGAHVRSLRAPGSTLDAVYPTTSTSPYRSGSGTSMAAALVSGVAATTLQANPGMTPDAVKHALVAAGRTTASADPTVVGAGMVDAARTTVRPEAGLANAGLARSNGRGELSDSRGSLEMRTDGLLSTLLTGRQTAQLLLWDPLGYTTGGWSPFTWSTSLHATVGWNTARWKNAVLTGSQWTGSNWTGSNWTGSNWTGSNWTGSNWTGSSWYGEDDAGADYGRHGPGSGSYGAWD